MNKPIVYGQKISYGSIRADQIQCATIGATLLEPSKIIISGETTLSDWRNPRPMTQQVSIVPKTWPTGCMMTQDIHRQQGPWKETLEVKDEGVLWRVEFPGLTKDSIKPYAFNDTDGELVKIKVSAPYLKDGNFIGGDFFTVLEVPEIGCYIETITYIDGVFYVAIGRGQEVIPLEIN